MHNKHTSRNVQSLRLFEDLTSDQRRTLAPLLDMQHFHRGEFLFHIGEVADQLYFLRTGTAKVSVLSAAGEEHILDVVLLGDTFGEWGLGANTPHVAAAQALSNVTVQTMSQAAFGEILQSYPHICHTFVRHLIERQRRLWTRLVVLLGAEAGPRLLAILLDLGAWFSAGTGDRYQVPGTLTQEDLARMAGLNHSTTSTLINEYRCRGILGGRGRRLVVHHSAAAAVLQNAGLSMLT
jgi:CRP/FNR family cyclic AMP-dependent transcriptional regulator